ncbi:S-phase kinase-associated 2 [Paramuricea clavata]|uniref:S-phase kinase-associated 2, partial n=1 Tax=Paramuricea clavata TaxID=317549 RepID=A0A7D9L7D2_PARCT|nr:S-phase kinase-associated 2 [Paramuricea clavata]
MQDSDSHSVSGTERKLDCSSTLPDEILEKIFLELPLYDVMKLSLVCKRWYVVSRSNSVWQKFIPRYPGIHQPKTDTQYDVFRKLWLNSLQIGTERWFPNPLPELVDYDAALREEESKESGETVDSKCVLYLRLNPVYPFTTDGLNTEDPVMVETVQAIFDEFGHVEDLEDNLFIRDAKSAMSHSDFVDKQQSMEFVVYCLESQNFLEVKRNPHRDFPELDEEGYREKIQDDQNFVDDFEDGSNQRKNHLNDELFSQIRTILLDKNNDFVSYCLDDGCYRGTCPYARNMVVSDTAVIFCVQYYGNS